LGLKKLTLYYLNSKYLQGFRNNFCIFELLITKIYLKNVLNIIYEYHRSNCKILFIGFPEFKNDKFTILFEKTKHYYIPSKTWINNIIINRSQVLDHLQLKTSYSDFNNKNSNIIKNLNKIFKIRKKPDLIILYNQKFEQNAFRESILSNIPLITFLNSSDLSNQVKYKIPIGTQNKISERFCYFLLKSILTFPRNKKVKLIPRKKFKKKFRKFRQSSNLIDFWY